MFTRIQAPESSGSNSSTGFSPFTSCPSSATVIGVAPKLEESSCLVRTVTCARAHAPRYACRPTPQDWTMVVSSPRDAFSTCWPRWSFCSSRGRLWASSGRTPATRPVRLPGDERHQHRGNRASSDRPRRQTSAAAELAHTQRANVDLELALLDPQVARGGPRRDAESDRGGSRIRHNASTSADGRTRRLAC